MGGRPHSGDRQTQQSREAMDPQNESFPRSSTVSILQALKHYPDERVFVALTDYFFHPDTDISVEAIRSSAHRTNDVALPHLLHLVEKGEQNQKLEALQALAVMHAPLALDSLLNYFAHYEDAQLKREILKTLNVLVPFQEKILELNRGVLTHNYSDEELCKIAIRGLIESEDFSYLDYYLHHASDEVQYEAFRTLYHAKSRKAVGFLKKFETETSKLADRTRGAYLGAYYLNIQSPNASFSLKLLQKSPREVYLTFLKALDENIEHSASPKNIFRFLLLLPFVDGEVEVLISELIKKILERYGNLSPGTRSEFCSIASVHLDQLFRKARERHISIRALRNKDDFLPTLFAHLVEKYCSASYVREVLKYFREEGARDPSLLIEAMRECLIDAEPSDISGFKACVPLFLESETKQRLKIYTFLKRIEPQVTDLLRRLNRIIKAVGYLQMTALAKLVREIRSFAVDEKIGYLEEASTITLCQIQPAEIVEEAKEVLAHHGSYEDIIKSFVRGARYLPSSEIAESLVDFLIGVGCTYELRGLALESLENLDLGGSPSAHARLIGSLERGDIDGEHKEAMAGIAARYLDRPTIQSVIDLLSSGGSYSKIIGMRIVQQIGKRRHDLPVEVLTGKLYSLIESSERDLRVEALMSLLSLGDDYAEKIVQDWLSSGDEQLVRYVLRGLGDHLTEKILPNVIELVHLEEEGVQEALRALLPALAQSPYEALVRNGLLEALASPPSEESTAKRRREDERIRGGQAFLHPKLEFQFRRENSQVLTVFFIDMVGYTMRTSQTDVTNLMQLIKTFEDNAIPSLERFRGHVVKKLGDGILAVFKHPVSAAIAALEVRRRIEEYNRYSVDSDKFQVRIGLDTGTVIWKDNDVFGDIVNTASRMETTARPGEILITENVYRQISDFVICESRGEMQVKGKEGEVRVYAPLEVSREVKAFLEIKKMNAQAVSDEKSDSTASRLKEAFFVPRFDIPPGVSQGVKEPDQFINLLHTLFSDMARAASEITHDYHEEYLFKQYLQDRWNATIADLRSLG
jgi:class 3 adenylate cyclase